MNHKAKLLLFIFLLITSAPGYCQLIRKSFRQHEFDSIYYFSLCKEFGQKKNLPRGFEKQTLHALEYYPELKNVRIKFKLRKNKSPLMVRPSVVSSIFRSAKKRTYIVLISYYSSQIDSVVMKNLPLDAQIGVLGHELSHVSFFIKQGRFGMLKVAFGNLSSRYLDKIEFETDRSTIEHGLGWQLLCWSELVRIKLKMERWKGIDEYIHGKAERPRGRYMNPETIKAVIAESPLYQ